MKRFLAVAVLCAVLVGGWSWKPAQAVNSYACVGPPADYLSAFDTVRGQAADGAVTYPYKTVYLEWQGWLTPNDGVSVPGHHSEHLHEGGCVPEGQTLDNANGSPWFLDAKYILHNVIDYTVNQASATVVDDIGSQNVFLASPQQVSDLNAAAQASGGLNTVSVFQSYQSASPAFNGMKELRWQLNVVRNSSAALVDQWRVSARSYLTYNFTGLTTRNPVGVNGSCHVDFVRTQNWTSLASVTRYNYAGFGDSLMDGCVYPSAFTPDAMAVPKTGDFTGVFRSTDGTNAGDVFVDPNFHVHPDSYVWTQVIDPREGMNIPVNVPVSTLNLVGERHVFMVRGHKYPDGVNNGNPISTAITVLPFYIPRDTQAPTSPSSLVKSNPQASSVVLSWGASSDNVGVAGYRVYRDGVQVADVNALSVTVDGLSAPSHLLEVEAYDAAGNVSARSAVTVTRTWQ